MDDYLVQFGNFLWLIPAFLACICVVRWLLLRREHVGKPPADASSSLRWQFRFWLLITLVAVLVPYLIRRIGE